LTGLFECATLPPSLAGGMMLVLTLKPEEVVEVNGEGTIKNISDKRIKLGFDGHMDVDRVPADEQPTTKGVKS
jgi:hypothetical protein